MKSEEFTTKYSEKRSVKKRTFQRMVLAQSDVHAACQACELLMEKVCLPEIGNLEKTAGLNNPLYVPLLDAVIISYARPFIHQKGIGRLPKKWSEFEDARMKQTHGLMIRYRNELVAHTDQEVRKIQIVPPKTLSIPLPRGMRPNGIGFRVKSYMIVARHIPNFHQLSAYQAARLWHEVERLFDELYEDLELPNREFDLRIDEGL